MINLFNIFESNLTYSYKWITKFKLLVNSNNLWWQDPIQSTNFYKEEVLEWWYYNHKLIVYITKKKIEYLKVWGTDIDTEMEDGVINTQDDLLKLWKWLTNYE